MKTTKTIALVAGLLLAIGVCIFTSSIDVRAKAEAPEETVDLGADGCPSGAESDGLGPEMVRLPDGFCVDTTEVTREQYGTWLETNPAVAGGTSCSANDSYEPSCQWPPGGNDSKKPVVCVDWCDAQAFCSGAGKRLCGTVGTGAPYAFSDYANAGVSEWQNACSSGGKFDYSFGDTYEATTCRSADAEDYTTWGIVDVGSLSECHSSDNDYAALFDLSGNVAEWDGSCGSDDPDANCRIRGGSYEHHEIGLRCAMGETLEWPRDRKVSSVGFRCCAD